MGKGYKHGGSGGANPLNFEVKAYPSETEMNLATAKANTIGVVTTNPITGWYFDVEQPENMAEGEIWFGVGTSSPVEFNALKKNNVMVYPISAKQMVSGNLADLIVKTFDGEKWKSWITYLYNAGDECSDITGGWGVAGYTDSDTTNTTLAGTKNSDHLLIWYVPSGGNYYLYGFGTAKAISFADYTELVIDVEHVSGGNFAIFINDSKTPYNANHEGALNIAATDGNGERKLDISKLNGSYYIYLRPDAYTSSPPKWKIKSVSLR